MKSSETLEKYIRETFDNDVVVVNKTSVSAEIILPDGRISLLVLGTTVNVYIDYIYYQTLELCSDGYFHLFYNSDSDLITE